MYLRFTRDAVPCIYDEEETFEIGRAKRLNPDHSALSCLRRHLAHRRTETVNDIVVFHGDDPSAAVNRLQYSWSDAGQRRGIASMY